MTQSSSGYHEPLDLLPEETRNIHRALVTVIEELEAVDWYSQRAAAASDPELKKILIHHRDEEIEHAIMALEWLRRVSPEFAEAAKTYLFTEASITEIEEAATGSGSSAGEATAEPADGSGRNESQANKSGPGSSLGIGDLKRR